MINEKYDLKEIGERIRGEREKKGLSLEELGHRVNVSRQTLSKWERGVESSSPTLPDFLRLCNEFGCDLQYLLCENDCMTKDLQGVVDYTGLSEVDVLTLADLSKKGEEIRKVVFSFLHDLIDSFNMIDIAIKYDRYKKAYYNQDSYSVFDDKGNYVDMLSGDVGYLLLERAFRNFIDGEENSLKWSELRKMDLDSISDLFADIQRGK